MNNKIMKVDMFQGLYRNIQTKLFNPSGCDEPYEYINGV